MSFTQTEPRLRYWEEGEGSPVLMVMGFGMRGEIWLPQARRLREHHRVAYYDARGIGESDRGLAWSMKTQADDARRVLDALGWSEAHVVGVSMGGMVAQELALRAPDRVRSLGLIATHAGGRKAWVPTWEGLALFVRANTSPPERRLQHLIRLLYPDAYAQQAADEIGEKVAAMLSVRASRKTLVAQLCSVLRHDTRHRLRGLRTPTLVLGGDSDILVRPAQTSALASLIEAAEHTSFPGAGHGVVHQCAEEVAACLLRHFARVESARLTTA